MTAATLTATYDDFLPGFKLGYLTGQDNYTTTFGLSYVDWAMVCSKNNDDAIVSVEVSSGDATLGMVDDAGAGVSADTEVWFIAKGT